jgi:lipoyl-dependent peroxiredoxin
MEVSMAIKVLYTAHATAVGGRNGHTQSADGLVSVELSISKAMGNVDVTLKATAV